jgi:uncharacterized oxidoreductase
MANPHVFKPAPLARAIEAIVTAGGSEPREARLVAENLVTANLTGHDSHGIGSPALCRFAGRAACVTGIRR